MSLEQIKQKITPILRSAGIRRAGLFGSAARGTMTAQSDVDILVDVRSDMGLLEFISLQNQLADILGSKVDLVEYQALKPALKQGILRQEVAIF